MLKREGEFYFFLFGGGRKKGADRQEEESKRGEAFTGRRLSNIQGPERHRRGGGAKSSLYFNLEKGVSSRAAVRSYDLGQGKNLVIPRLRGRKEKALVIPQSSPSSRNRNPEEKKKRRKEKKKRKESTRIGVCSSLGAARVEEEVKRSFTLFYAGRKRKKGRFTFPFGLERENSLITLEVGKVLLLSRGRSRKGGGSFSFAQQKGKGLFLELRKKN